MQTVTEAMALARDEKRKYKEWQDKKSNSRSYRDNNKPNVTVPDWLKQEKAPTSQPDETSSSSTEDENRKWLESLLNSSK